MTTTMNMTMNMNMNVKKFKFGRSGEIVNKFKFKFLTDNTTMNMTMNTKLSIKMRKRDVVLFGVHLRPSFANNFVDFVDTKA